MLRHVIGGAIGSYCLIIEFTFEGDLGSDTELFIVITFDRVFEVISRAASINCARHKVLIVVLKHKNAIIATISSLDSQLRRVSCQLLVDNDTLTTRLHV